MQAGGLTAISSALNPGQAATVVKVGEPVPDFTLTDQSGEQIHLSQFRNKVVALTFGYSRYPIPTTAGACRTTLQAWNAASQAVLGATSSSSPSIPNTTMERPLPTTPRYGMPILQMALPVGIKARGKARRKSLRHGLLARRRSSHSLTSHCHHRPQRAARRESRRQQFHRSPGRRPRRESARSRQVRGCVRTRGKEPQGPAPSQSSR